MDTNIFMAVIVAAACLGALVGVAVTTFYFQGKVEDRANDLYEQYIEYDRKQFRSNRIRRS